MTDKEFTEEMTMNYTEAMAILSAHFAEYRVSFGQDGKDYLILQR